LRFSALISVRTEETVPSFDSMEFNSLIFSKLVPSFFAVCCCDLDKVSPPMLIIDGWWFLLEAHYAHPLTQLLPHQQAAAYNRLYILF